MTNDALSRQAVRDYDANAIAFGIPGPVLMENAARGAVELLLSLGAVGPVAIVCGKGNNAGDGFVIARLLAVRGIDVWLELVVDPEELSGDAATAFAPLASLGIERQPFDEEKTTRRLRGAEWVVDALLGTGTKGSVRSPYDRAIDTINDSGRRVLSVDLPSGLDADTGECLGPTVGAERTVTFVARKMGFANPRSAAFTGQVHVVPIGARPPSP
ncbi:Bifunctional NAD(P)H-hydrate repair enzyme Nnr [Planctomycetes bacterium Pan216]|uniref:NAD(P)H-hydrate epimerase n=1 Tax=Kolteria novifilia TaxID=2527975 RepID=A0A518BBW2_9BACT|nr:Bifunctional NAD(P)H-hydrate repair enzyme Nnr [Planctomycetes bacterium Pan216]